MKWHAVPAMTNRCQMKWKYLMRMLSAARGV